MSLLEQNIVNKIVTDMYVVGNVANVEEKGVSIYANIEEKGISICPSGLCDDDIGNAMIVHGSCPFQL